MSFFNFLSEKDVEILSVVIIAFFAIVSGISAFLQWRESRNMRKIAIIAYMAALFDYVEISANNRMPEEIVTKSVGRKVAFLRRHFERDARDLLEFSSLLINEKYKKKKNLAKK